MADLTPERLAELRHLATEANPTGRLGWGWAMERCVEQYQPDDQVRLYFDIPEVLYLAALPPSALVALLDRLEAAEARVEEIDEEREDWETSHRDLAEHHAALSEFARSMATAIGWDETPGDSWVEKALNWRHDPESLPGLYAELNRLRPIVAAVAAVGDTTGWLRDLDLSVCVLCGDDPHEDDCPWVAAKAWAAENVAVPGAVAGEPGGEQP